MIENRISDYLYNERFSESNEEKCTAFQSMVSKRSASCICFPIFFRFHKCFNNFHLSKNILINKFFTETYVSL